MQLQKGEFLGTFSKTYGTGGQLLLKFNPDLKKKLLEKELVIIEIDKDTIPFFIENIEYRNNRSAIIKFFDFDAEQYVQEFIGRKVYLEYVPDTKYKNNGLNEITGFKVIDKNIGELGEITEIKEYSQNIVIKVQKGKKEILIPFSKDIVLKVDSIKKLVETNCPDGLVDINS